MKLGENGGRMAMLGGALAAGLAGAPDQAEAQDFNAYCAPLANGEVLESQLTPQNMGYIFDENGKVIGARADELTQYYGDGITEKCGEGDVGAYVSKYGERIMLEIYPPGQYPLGIDPKTFQEIQVNYSSCVGSLMEVVDENRNGLIDENEDRGFYKYGEQSCNRDLQGSMRHAGEVAALNVRQAAAEQRIIAADERIAAAEQRIAAADARIEAQTKAIIQGARKQVGFN